MAIEALVPEIVKTLREISPWPWSLSNDNGSDVSIIDARNMLRVLVYPEEGPEVNLMNRDFVLSSPIWLAQLVVSLVEERASIHSTEGTCGKEPHILYPYYSEEEALSEALRDFSLSPGDWTWLKEGVGKRVEG